MTTRPMEFPKSHGLRTVLLILFCLMGGPVLVLGLPVVAWMYTLPPLQQQYLPAYVSSTFGEKLPRNLTTIRWMMKTGPGRRPVTLLPGDVVSDRANKTRMALSPEAQAQGWTGLLLQPSQQVRSSELAPHLRGMIYGGDELW